MGETTVQGRIHTRNLPPQATPISHSLGYGSHREPIANLGLCWIEVHGRQA